ncbi:MAG: outer membrane lipoprotein-sorting protein [Myxococcales bacterium]|nr:outer membrane lipoprotein-sorting protein [Myxococcales bacterium]
MAAAIASAWLPAEARAQAQDAVSAPPPTSALVQRAFDNLYADDYIQSLTLTTRARGGREISRRLQVTRKQSVRPSKTLLRFLEPYEIRRTSVLVLENEGESDDLYVYLPRVRLTRHLSSAQRKDSFFGTDLSYEDVEPKHAANYDSLRMGPGSVGGRACERIDLRARPPYESTYERQVFCIEVERAVTLSIDFYRNGRVLKRLEADPQHVTQVGGRYIPFRMTIATPKARSETLLVTEAYELRPEVPDELFTAWNLESGTARRDRSRAAGGEAENAR